MLLLRVLLAQIKSKPLQCAGTQLRSVESERFFFVFVQSFVLSTKGAGFLRLVRLFLLVQEHGGTSSNVWQSVGALQ